MNMVIGLTGLAGSGKTTVAKYLKEKYGYEFLTLSDIIKEEIARRGLSDGETLEEQKRYQSKFADEWRKETGKMDIVAIKMIEKVNSMKLNKVAIDGFRSPAEVDLFRNAFLNFKLIYVSTDFETRFQRRQKDDPTAKKEKMQERDEDDIERKGLQDVIEMADFVLDNNGTLKDLQHQIDVIVEGI